jgi:hydroxymethylpyrimidine pyrophosphatase-like HAD family hydrolase
LTRYRLLLLDIDGTLTAPDGHITAPVKTAVRAAVTAGVHVTLATGRSFALARTYAAELELRLPLIVHSGASVRDSLTGAVLYETPVPATAMATVVRMAACSRLQPILFQTGADEDRVLAGPPELDNEATDWYLGNKRGALVRRTIEELARSEPPLNIAVPAAHDAGVALLNRAIGVPDCRMFATRFQRHNWVIVEALAVDSSKAAAMRFLSTHLAVSREEVLAVGDQPNDLEMIEAAGLGIAMGNAAHEVKARADVVAPSNEDDGVAWVIDEFVLGKRTGDA